MTDVFSVHLHINGGKKYDHRRKKHTKRNRRDRKRNRKWEKEKKIRLCQQQSVGDTDESTEVYEGNIKQPESTARSTITSKRPFRWTKTRVNVNNDGELPLIAFGN
ncbi:hypothetical protein DFQ28_006081, partial [Apophysomyces sp. BC1034]